MLNHIETRNWRIATECDPFVRTIDKIQRDRP